MRASRSSRQRVLDATVDLLREAEGTGLSAVTLTEVAVRSGVARTTVYRHWDSLEDLILEAISDVVGPRPAPTGELGADLRAIAANVVDAMQRPEYGVALPLIVAQTIGGGELADRLRDWLIAPWFDNLAAVYTGARQETDLADVVLACELVIGGLLFQWMAHAQPPDHESGRKIADFVSGAGRTQPAAPGSESEPTN